MVHDFRSQWELKSSDCSGGFSEGFWLDQGFPFIAMSLCRNLFGSSLSGAYRVVGLVLCEGVGDSHELAMRRMSDALSRLLISFVGTFPGCVTDFWASSCAGKRGLTLAVDQARSSFADARCRKVVRYERLSVAEE